MTLLRLPLLLAALALLAAGSATAAPERGTGLDVTAPKRAVQGSRVAVTAAVKPAGTRCSLFVRYRTGSRQQGLGVRRASDGRVTWRFEVPRQAPTGAARATVSCGSAGSYSWTLMIIGSVIPAQIRVVNKGFSQRVHRTGGSAVSWGVILANDSPHQDALDVTVLANFVMPDNRLIGSATARVQGIAAGSQHAAGGDLNFVGAPPIARIEIVVTIGRRGPATRARPAIAHIRVVPESYDPAWVGSVEGELHNVDPRRTLESAQLTAVILDNAGNVIGGGNGYTIAPLPPGAREFIKVSGMRAVAMDRAASAVISIVARYD